MTREEERKTEGIEERKGSYFFPALAYSNRPSERQTREKELFMSAIYTANKHNAMACFGD